MKKGFAILLIVLVLLGVGLMLPHDGAAYQKVDSSGCLQCHTPGTPGGTDGLHGGIGHKTCSNCHSGTPAKGTVSSSKCIVCHPAANPGQCALANDHDPGRNASCLSCHSGCAPDNGGGGDTNPCAAEAIYGTDSQEVELLRNYRDNMLAKTPAGQKIIGLYYRLNPVITKAMEENETFRIVIKTAIDNILQILR